MNTTTSIDPQIIQRDGTSQQQRQLPALDPSYVLVEERTPKDWLLFAKGLANELYYYDANNKVAGNWSAFMAGNIEQMEAYLNNPEAFDPSTAETQWLARPHMALFMTFLQLLEQVKGHMNQLTTRHLEFCYRTALGLTKKAGTPDTVNVLIKPATDVTAAEVPAGTLLQAGQDALGNNLQYATQEHMLANNASVVSLKNLFIDKEIIGLPEARRKYEDKEQSLELMMQLALGQPAPGNDPPPYFDNTPVNLDFLEQHANLQTYLSNIEGTLHMTIPQYRRMMDIVRQGSKAGSEAWAWVNGLLVAVGQTVKEDPTFTLANTNSGNFLANVQTTYGKLNYTALLGAPSLDAFYEQMLLLESYFRLLIDEIAFITAFRYKIKPGTKVDEIPSEWLEVERLLQIAYTENTYIRRRATLKTVHDTKGFEGLLKYALGDPEPDDDLPYNALSLDQLYADMNSEQPDPQNTDYVESELYMKQRDFNTLIETKNTEGATAEQWEQVYSILELASRKKRNFTVPAAQIELWYNLYMAKDATQVQVRLPSEAGNENPRWNTFGSLPTASNTMEPAPLGFAFSAPVLELTEGARDIIVTIAFQEVGFDMAKLSAELNPIPFTFYLTTAKGFVEVADVKEVSCGAYIIDQLPTGTPVDVTFSADDSSLNRKSGAAFRQDDIGKLIVTKGGKAYRIDAYISTDKLTVTPKGDVYDVQASTDVKYDEIDVYVDALRFHIALDANHPAIETFQGTDQQSGLKSDWPVLKVLLKNREKDGLNRPVIEYQLMKSFDMVRAHILVKAAGMAKYEIQNDNSTLDPKKPFELFGNYPDAGNSFYLTHRELVQKKLESLTLDVEWMGVPAENLKTWYNHYPSQGQTTNANYKVRAVLRDKNTLLPLGDHALFNVANHAQKDEAGTTVAKGAQAAISVNFDEIPRTVAKAMPLYNYEALPDYTSGTTVLDWDRYLRLELLSPNFGHDSYSAVLSKKSLQLSSQIAKGVEITDAEYQKYAVNEPYAPKIKSLGLNYSASATYTFTGGYQEKAAEAMYHIQPFGFNKLYNEVDEAGQPHYYLLPQHNDEGELYIGLNNINAPQDLSLLFQLAEGSANPDVEAPALVWSFLGSDRWHNFGEQNIRADATNGLLNSGIVKLNIPQGINGNNCLLPNGTYWLRVAAAKNTEALCHTVDILANAVSATFVNNDNDPNHLAKPLPANTITQTVSAIPDVGSIEQPFTSANGKMPERNMAFYTRASERLRHKNRALNIWDYERLVLEQFPEIFKVKCLPAHPDADAADIGQVRVVVIPEIKNKLPFNPYEPKVPANTLKQVAAYLQGRMPAYAQISVENPAYTQIKVRVAVKFKQGYDNIEFYTNKLETELVKYLAPWAYDEAADIAIGGKIYANVIVNFIEEREYVDFVARIKLFQSHNGIDFFDAMQFNTDGVNKVTTQRQNEILVSALTHEIDIIREQDYNEQDFTGIDYMKIELDFKVD